MKRIFLIVLDSCGAGEQPDSKSFGDEGVNTLRSCHQTGLLQIPNMQKIGIGNIEGLSFLGRTDTPTGAYCRLMELSKGKDTTIGHWEIAGLISNSPLPVYPNGFPEEIIREFEMKTGRGVLYNKPASGTAIINELGDEHRATGKLIVYTSADSVFQIAAHEETVPLEELYRDCRIAREILQGEHGVGRVIARPFVGKKNGEYVRTSNRHDFSLVPPAKTLLDLVSEAGKDVIAVGKIHDIFAGIGMTETVYTHGNTDGLDKTLQIAKRDFTGLCFVNLVDFDSQYGHRRDPVGYAKALNEFDAWLPKLQALLGPDDCIMITADHGCDPCYEKTTDHTREYVPFLAVGPSVKAIDLGTREGFCDIGASCAELLSAGKTKNGNSFAEDIL